MGLKQAGQYKATLVLWLLLLFHFYVLEAKIFISLGLKNYGLEAWSSLLPRHAELTGVSGGLGDA